MRISIGLFGFTLSLYILWFSDYPIDNKEIKIKILSLKGVYIC